MTTPVYARATNEGLVLEILVQPRASRIAIGPVVGDRLKVALTAPPVDGAANKALVEALAATFGVGKSKVTILRGATGRRKTVRVEGASFATLAAVIGR